MLDQALGLFDHHLGYLHVTCGRFVEGGRQYFALYRTRHFGHFFRTLVDQEHNQCAFGMIVRNRMGNILQHHGLARLRRRNDQAPLTLAERCHQIDDTCGNVFGGAIPKLHGEAFLGEQRRHVLEQDLGLRRFGLVIVDAVDLEQREVTLVVPGRTDTTDH